MSRYFEGYDELGEYRHSLFDPLTPAAKPFDREAYNRLLMAVAEAGRQYGEHLNEQRRLRGLQKAAANDR